MAITATTVFQGQNMFIADVVSSADGDTTADINHGLGVAPALWFIIPTVGAGAAFAALPQWNITLPTSLKVTVNKVGTAGTAANGNFRLVVMTPHSIIK